MINVVMILINVMNVNNNVQGSDDKTALRLHIITASRGIQSIP